MASGRAVRAIVAGGAVLLAVAAWLWLGADAGSQPADTAAPIAAQRSSLDESVSLPESGVRAAEPLTDAAAAGGESSPGEVKAATPAPPTLATVGVPLVLSGRVIDPSGRPVAGAVVRHRPSPATLSAVGLQLLPPPLQIVPWDELPRTSTDPQGRFAFTVRELPRKDEPGQNESRPGGGMHKPPVVNVPTLIVIAAGFEATPHWCLGFQAGDLDVGDILIAPGSALAGRVVDEAGLALAEVRVTPSAVSGGSIPARLGDWSTVAQALESRSGADGRFLLDSLLPGELSVHFATPGYVPLDQDFTTSAGPAHDAGDVVLVRGGRIAGYVVDAGNRPLAGALVKVRAANLSSLGQGADSVAWEMTLTTFAKNYHQVETRTDVEGAFAIETLNQPAYNVLAAAPGHEAVKTEKVATGTRDLVIVLPAQASALVSVVDATSHAPVANVTASGKRHVSSEPTDGRNSTALEVLAESDAAKAAGSEADPVGLLLARGLGSRRNTLLVSAPGYATTSFELPGVQAPERIAQTLEMPREATLVGRVIDGLGAPVSGATITLTPPSKELQSLSPSEWTDGEGRFVCSRLAAGEWSLVASATGFIDSDARALVLVAGQELNTDAVILQRGGRITGLVLGANGAPSLGATVSAQQVAEPEPPTRITHSVVTGGDGRFVFECLSSGRFTVSCRPGADAIAEVVAGADAEVVLQLRAAPRVHGRVTDAAGPVANAVVFAQFEMPFGFMDEAETESATSGEYEIQFEMLGTYRVLASDGGATTPGRTVELQWDDDLLLDLAFGGERLDGFVLTGETGAPISGATVDLIDETLAVPSPDGEVDPASRVKLETDAVGHFESRRLNPGRHRVEASKSGYAPESVGPIDVPRLAGAEPLRLELQPGATVSGVVKTGAGTAVPRDVMLFIVGEDVLAPDGKPFQVSFNLPLDGSYNWNRLAAGTYLVQLRRRTSAMGAPSGWQQLSERRVTLASGQSETVDFLVQL